MKLIKTNSNGEEKEVCRMRLNKWSDCINFESEYKPRSRTGYQLEIDPYQYKILALALLSNLSDISGMNYRVCIVEDGKVVKWF